MYLPHRIFFWLSARTPIAIACLLSLQLAALLVAAERPNILIISSEDNGCELGCFGDTYSKTPNIDRLASQSVRYLNAWSNAPVCAPARTTIITGMWPPSLGASHMRSEVALPKTILLYPQLLRQNGYYCTNAKKEDYNVIKPEGVWDASNARAHWRNRAANQPFFAVFNIETSHESKLRTRPHKQVHDPAKVKLPAYHPDLPEIRQDWAQYYDRLTEMDTEVGEILDQLKQDGLADSTIVMFFGDHGSGMPRGKRWLYQSGLRVALMISVPEKLRNQVGASYKSGSTSDELVSFLDIAPTVLNLSQTEVPSYLHGRALLSKQPTSEHEYIFGFRDRMDERYDCSRAVRDKEFLYIRNFMPHRAQGQYLEYMYQTPTTVAWLNAAKSGKTTPAQSLFWQLKPSAELYDIQKDPQQTNNLIDNPEYSSQRDRLKSALRVWMIAKRDLGLMPEAIMKKEVDSQPNTIAELAKEDSWFPVEKIWDAADQATDLAVPESRVQTNLKSDNPIVRYWSAIGLTYRSLQGKPCQLDSLTTIINSDDSPVVSVVACETLARAGDKAQRAAAINRLSQIATDPKSSFFEQLLALESMMACNLSKDEIPGGLSMIEKKKSLVPSRYETYPIRAVKAIQLLSENEALHTPIK
ncbi:MAG: sulfatase [Planctomycetota bacterium]|nr:sulfatase [Planctomycetota bacterium]